MNAGPEELSKLHSLYCQLTGFDLSTRYDRERSWYEYVKAGFTVEDLRLVITHLQRAIKKKERHSGCLKFSNLVECLNYFEEDLAIAKAQSRNNRPTTNRDEVVRVFRPVVVPAPQIESCKPVKGLVEKLILDLKNAAK